MIVCRSRLASLVGYIEILWIELRQCLLDLET